MNQGLCVRRARAAAIHLIALLMSAWWGLSAARPNRVHVQRQRGQPPPAHSLGGHVHPDDVKKPRWGLEAGSSSGPVALVMLGGLRAQQWDLFLCRNARLH
jgi:hypothetical protein